MMVMFQGRRGGDVPQGVGVRLLRSSQVSEHPTPRIYTFFRVWRRNIHPPSPSSPPCIPYASIMGSEPRFHPISSRTPAASPLTEN